MVHVLRLLFNCVQHSAALGIRAARNGTDAKVVFSLYLHVCKDRGRIEMGDGERPIIFFG